MIIVTQRCKRMQQSILWSARKFVVVSVLLGSSTAHAMAMTSFAPTAAPRFDSFAEAIVGSWTTTCDTSSTPLEVEEVMRSCGGAVQGVREVALVDNAYMNRANDGFVYYPCGSYTMGPVLFPTDKNVAAGEKFIVSVQLSKSYRVLTDFSLSPIGSVTGTRVFAMSTSSVSNRKLSHQPQLIFFEDPPPASFATIDWSNKMQCRMPSTGIEWNKQRVKWECCSELADLERQDDDNNDVQESIVSLFGVWVTCEYSNDGGMSLTLCVVDQGAKRAVSLVRDYDDSGGLAAVCKMEGRCI